MHSQDKRHVIEQVIIAALSALCTEAVYLVARVIEEKRLERKKKADETEESE